MRRIIIKLNIPRVVALFLAITLLLVSAPIASATEVGGSCGDGLTWNFSSGTLTISGSGDMADYTEWSLPPWYSIREEILQLSLPSGLTSVGDMAFYDCTNLTSITIPSKVTDIGELAFCQNRSAVMLSLNAGLRSIGRSAFEQCESLQDLRIPESVTYIGSHAFYQCTSLAYVTVPSSVTQMGSGVFAYCHSLIRAEVDASVSTLPTWTFYGCESLNSVSFDGTAVNAEEAKQGMDGNGAGTANSGTTNNQLPAENGNTASSLDVRQEETGEIIVDNSYITKTDKTTINSTTSSTITDKGTSVEINITASVVDPEGWDEVVEQIQAAESIQKGAQEGEKSAPVHADVYVTGESSVPKNVMEELAGINVILAVQTESGSKFTVDCAGLDKGRSSRDLNLAYKISVMQNVPEKLSGILVYQLTFDASSTINAEVMIQLPIENTRKTASLYQLEKDDVLTLLQSVVVDDSGYAHFYLGSVDHGTEYLIGIDVPGEETLQAIVPEVLHNEYHLVDQETGIEYVVTGRSSSWGMNLGQVMGILAVVMIAVIAIVGIAMFALNKRKLKMGYVPELDEEDYM